MRTLWNTAPVRFLREALSLYLDRRVAQAASGLAYFVLLTVFPVLICVSYLLGLANIHVTTLVLQLKPFLPPAALEVIGDFLGYASAQQSVGLFIAGLAGCWFSAAAAYRTISRVIVDVYHGVKLSPLRNLMGSILFPPMLILALYLSVLVVVTGEKTLHFIALRLPFLSQFLALWNWLRYVLLFAVFFLLILTIFRAASPRGTPVGPMMVSSLAAAVALAASSGLFSWFIGMSSRYSLVYGSLVSVVVLLIWLYLCGQILFLAVVFTGTWHKWRKNAP